MVRFKNRYQLVQIAYDDGSMCPSTTERSILTAIRCAVELMHGDFGSACLQQSMAVKYFNAATGLFIVRLDSYMVVSFHLSLLRCHREFHPLLASAVPFVTSINQKQVSLHTLQVAGCHDDSI